MADERFEPGESNANCNHNMVGIPLKMHQEISFHFIANVLMRNPLFILSDESDC